MSLYDNPNYNKSTKIKITEKDAAQALYDAWYDVYNEYPSYDSLTVLLAKTALETGRFKVGFYNYNFGNIKAKNVNTQQFQMYECGEIINGKWSMYYPPNPQCIFVSYNSLKEGAIDYIKFVSQKQRYKKAWEEVIKGDPKQYVIELKKAGYFTAKLEPYLNTVIKLFNEYKVKINEWNISPSMSLEDIQNIEDYENKQIMNQVGCMIQNQINEDSK